MFSELSQKFSFQLNEVDYTTSIIFILQQRKRKPKKPCNLLKNTRQITSKEAGIEKTEPGLNSDTQHSNSYFTSSHVTEEIIFSYCTKKKNSPLPIHKADVGSKQHNMCNTESPVART